MMLKRPKVEQNEALKRCEQCGIYYDTLRKTKLLPHDGIVPILNILRPLCYHVPLEPTHQYCCNRGVFGDTNIGLCGVSARRWYCRCRASAAGRLARFGQAIANFFSRSAESFQWDQDRYKPFS